MTTAPPPPHAPRTRRNRRSDQRHAGSARPGHLKTYSGTHVGYQRRNLPPRVLRLLPQLRSTWHCRRSIRRCRTHNSTSRLQDAGIKERRTQDAMCTSRPLKNHTSEGRWGVPRMHREISRPDKQPKHASLLGLPPRIRNTFRGRTIKSRSTATRRSGQALRRHR